MTGYVRTDTTNNIADGNIINAADFDAEYNAIEAAFNASTGHTHDGTSTEGAAITKVGPAQDVTVSSSAVLPKTDNTLDLGSALVEFKDLYIDGTANIDSLVADTADINAGTIDGTAIGAASASTGAFTTLSSNSTTTLNGTTIPASVTLVSTVATQTMTGKTISVDDNTVSGVAASSFVLSNGSGNIDGSVAQKAIPSGVVVGNSDTQTLTNKTLTSPVIATIVNTGTLTLPTSTDTLVGRATTDTLTNKTLTSPVIGTIVNTGTLTLPTSTDTLVGRATTDTLTNKTISGSTNTLTNIANASLTNSSVTVGSTNVALGATSTTLAGLSSVTSTSFVGALTGNASTATALQTGRAINGVTFNGTAPITITAVNPNALTIGGGLSGGSYDGSGAVTVAIDSTVATLTGTQTLTNKTLTSPTINGGVISGITDLAVADGGTGSSTAAAAKVALQVVTGSTGSAIIPVGTEAQRDGSPNAGFLRFNNDTSFFEGYNGAEWGAIGGEASVEDLAVSRPTIKPSLLLDFANVERLDPRITFNRASEGRFYGTQTAKAEQNLVLNSQEFDNAAWGKAALSVFANSVAAPDGTTTAETLTEDSSTAAHNINNSMTVTSGAIATISVFAKRNGRDFQIFFGSGDVAGNPVANFDLTTGSVGTTGGTITASIQSVGNSWFRCIVTVTAAVSSGMNVIFGLTNSTSAARSVSYAGDGTSGLYLWGAQYEERSAVTAYTPTTYQPITNYIPVLQTAASGVARFDHSPTTFESLGLLIEEQRTNLSIRSEEFDQWASGLSAVVFANATIAPNGTLTADKVAPVSGTGNRGIGLGITGLTGTAVTSTVYAKAAERSLIQIRWFGGGTGISSAHANFDLINGTTAGSATLGISMTPVGNGWWRCVASTAITGALVDQQHAIEFIDSLSDVRRPTISGGNGFNGVYLWGAQLEAGAFPTSYIPTVASQVTRSGDIANITGENFSSWFNQNESTFYSEAATIAPPSNIYHSVLNASLGSSTAAGDYLRVAFFNTLKTDISVGNSGVFTTLNAASLPSGSAGNFQKAAVAISFNDLAGTVSSVTPVTSTARGRVAAVDRLSIGTQAGVTSNRSLNGTVKKIAYYPKRLTNAELQGLTS